MDGGFEGGCLCGAIRYRVRGIPIVSVACHCKFCQRRLGSAFATFAYFDETNVDLVGEVKEYEHRSDESGRWLRIQFCPGCGTTIAHDAEGRPGQRAVALGTLDDPDRVKVERHVWVRSKRPWVSIPPDVAAFPKGSASAAPPKAP
jgi:hypothetical protein